MFSCSKNPHTDYKIEVISTSERVSTVSVIHHNGAGSQGNGSYHPYMYKWFLEFKGTRKSQLTVDAICYDENFVPSAVTIKIYRKNKIVKEATGSGNFQLKYND